MKDIIKDVESIYNDFDNNLITVPKTFNLSSKSGRLVGSGSKHNGIYRLTYPVTGNEIIDNVLRTHEYGHVYLGHFEGIHEEMDRSLIRIINNRDSQLIKMVNEKCNIDYADQILDRVISEPFLNHFIHGISMDMEVNSVVLNDDDINNATAEVNSMLYNEYMKLSENGTKKPSKKAMDNLYSKFDLKLIRPSDFGFPNGLTYPDYLVQCILHLDLVLNLLSNNVNNSGTSDERMNQQNPLKGDQDQNSSGSGEGQEGESNENSQSQSQNQSNCQSNKSMPKTMEEFDEMMRNAQGGDSKDQEDQHESDETGTESSDTKDDQNENTEESNGGGQDKDNDDKDDDENEDQGSDGDQSDEEDESESDHGTDSRIEADDRRRNDLNNYSSQGGSGRGLNRSDSIRNYEINNDPLNIALEEVIRDYRHKVIKRDFTKDMTHKYNRRILGKNNKMLSPTYRLKITKTEEPTILFAVDVSGSMDTGLVNRIITTIRNEMKRINRGLKYNIAAWDTELQQYYRDITFNTPIPKLSCCGGTRMEGVFDLFKQDFGKDSILILISDFGDDLDSWHKKEKDMKGYSMYGFKYGSDSYWGNSRMPEFENFKVRKCD